MFITLLLCLCACKQFTSDSPLVEYNDSNNSLNIKNFSWSYGTVELNSFHGDFDALDKKVFDLLKGKNGICEVRLQDTGKDKYGNPNDGMDNIGTIDIDELNRFQDWTYWQKEHGIRSLLYKKYIQRESTESTTDSSSTPAYNNLDTTTRTPKSSTTVVDTTTTIPISSADKDFGDTKTYLFSVEQLYPTGTIPPDSESERFVITGTIDKIKFNEGVFGIITIDGDKVVMMFDPDHMEPSEVQRLSSVLVYGNKIKCVGTNAGERLYALLAAKIIEP